MTDTHTDTKEMAEMTREEMMSALFAHLVGQQTNMAMMLMGKVAHPQTGETVKDLDSARLFIDQLEMLEAKTKNNLSKEEERMLKQALMTLRLTFVEEMKSPAASTPNPPPSEPRAGTTEAKSTESQPASAGAPETATSEPEENWKKFTKKY